MNLTLSPDVEAMIEQRIRFGEFGSPEAVVTAALLSFQDDESPGDFAPGEWNALLDAAKRSGPPLDGEAVFERLRARGAAAAAAATASK